MPGKFDFVALTRQWSVTFIRNKKRTSYVIDGKYITSISEVREHTVKGSSQNDTYTVNLQDCEQHYEIEVCINPYGMVKCSHLCVTHAVIIVL